MVATKLMTVEEFEEMPDDGKRYELVRGELREMPAGGLWHGDVGFELGSEVRNHVRPNRLGRVFLSETGFRMFPDQETVRMPDVAYVRAEVLATVENYEKFGRMVPDLVIEVVSPTDRRSEVQEKIDEYLAAGVRLIWVVEPRLRIITAYTLGRDPKIFTDSDVLDGSDVLPDFRFPLAELFQTP